MEPAYLVFSLAFLLVDFKAIVRYLVVSTYVVALLVVVSMYAIIDLLP